MLFPDLLATDEGKAAAPLGDVDRVIRIGDLCVDSGRHSCTWKQKNIHLTRTEFALLRSLVQYPGFVKTREQLHDEVRGPNIFIGDRCIDSHVKRLRQKFKEVDNDFAQIKTIWGVGYQYRE